MKSDWDDFFSSICWKGYWKSLSSFIDESYLKGNVFPPRDLLWAAFDHTSPKTLKAVILGQDPYPNLGQAMGLSFSVPKGVKTPPSLENIFADIKADLGYEVASSGDLTGWAEQGVLLLNVYLTVESGKPLSHKRKEYELFAKDLFLYLDRIQNPIVFFLWGNFAKRFAPFVKNPKHLLCLSGHPSPLSANRGLFFGTGQFKKADAFYREMGVKPIDWAAH